ncbi:microtubule-associated protein TORTIFOLIA1-like, partial [Trifolium medium]|nr:microtubule-associated protein TORTIFOLIA1-like [Trifolium medium]
SALSSNKRRSSVVSRKLNQKNWDVQVAMADQGDLQEMNENKTPLEMNRAFLNKNSDDKMKKHGGSKAGSRVVPYHEESQDSVPVSNVPKDLFKNDKESEELSLIRNQLQQIEKQQSSLLDLLQVCC